MKKKIYYWSPCLTNVGTVKSTVNSAISLAKYNLIYDVRILNVFGEWTIHEKYLEKNGVRVQNLTFNYDKFLPKFGYIKSRLSYLIIFFLSFFPLLFLLKRDKPDFLVAHLITSLPLTLINLFNFKTKFILRISGYPKLHYLRKKLWEISKEKLEKITCPSLELKKDLEGSNIFDRNNIRFLPDAIINIEDFINKVHIEKKKDLKNEHFLSVGRFTKQKNYFYLINEFELFVRKYPNEKLVILGEGELKEKVSLEIKKKKLEKNIIIPGKTDNVYKYMKNSKALIHPSLWEEVGFVLVEAALSNLFIISSDCKNGPKEFLSNGEAGMLFNSKSKNELKEKLELFMSLEKEKILKKKIMAKKNSMKYSLYRHYKEIDLILNEN